MNDLLLWQLADSAFPAGGFAHSNGFEASFQYGMARTIDDVDRLVKIAVRQAGRGTLPFAMAAHRDPSRLAALDRDVDLFLNQPVSNRASRAQGRALLNTMVRVFGARTSDVAHAGAASAFAAHHAPVHGALFAALAIDANVSGRLFLYQVARSVISAAVRLGAIGMFDGQSVQHAAAAEIDRTLEACRHIAPEDAAQSAPISDLLQSTQDRLYSRLFQS